MAAHPFLLPLPQFPNYSDAYLGQAGASIKHLLNLSLPVPPSLLLPTSTLTLLLESSPHRSIVLSLIRRWGEATSPSQQKILLKQLQQTIETLPLEREAVHTLNKWYHDYLGGKRVIVNASSLPHLQRVVDHGNVNLLEAILKVWAESLGECVKGGGSAHPCLTPSPICLTQQVEADFVGVLYTQHPERLSKASIVIDFYSGDHSKTTQPSLEQVELDVRSGIILRRTQTPLESEKNPKPIQFSQELISRLVRIGSKLKQSSLTPLTARLSIGPKHLYVTECSTAPVLSTTLCPSSRKATATQVYLTVSQLSQAKRSDKLADGVGMLSLDEVFLATGKNPLNLLSSQTQFKKFERTVLQIIKDLSTNSTLAQPLLIRPPDFGLPDWAKTSFQLKASDSLQPNMLRWLEHLLQSARSEITPLIGLLPTNALTPLSWKEITRRKGFLPPPTQPHLLWLEISTPAMAIGLRHFDLSQTAGVVVNVGSLLSLGLGLDHSAKAGQNEFGLSTHTLSFLLNLIHDGVHAHNLQGSFPIWVILDRQWAEHIDTIMGVLPSAILCNSGEVAQAKEAVAQAEQNRWRRKSPG